MQTKPADKPQGVGYTKIIDYLKKTDPDFYRIINLLEITGLFSLKKNVPGITFLHPIDADFRKKINDLATSNDAAKMEESAKMIAALIIYDNFHSLTDFMNNRDRVINCLNQRIEINKIIGGEVHFKSGAYCYNDNQFVDNNKSKKLSVWKIVGSIPIDGNKIQRRRTKRATEDTNAQVEVKKQDQSIRNQIIHKVENAFLTEMINRKRSELTPMGDAYIEALFSLLSFLTKNDVYHNILLCRVLPMLSFDRADFYLLIEPYKDANCNYLIPADILTEWFMAYKPANIGEVYRTLNGILNNSRQTTKAMLPDCLMYTNPQEALNIISDARGEIIDMNLTQQNTISTIMSQYNRLLQAKILPNELMDRYFSPNQKAYEDEFRYILFHRFKEICDDVYFDRMKFDALISTIRDYNENGLLVPILLKDFKQTINVKSKMKEVLSLVNSSHFFYFPLSEENLKEYPHEVTLTKTNSVSDSIYFLSEIIRRTVRPLINTKKKNKPDHDEEILELAKMLKAQGGNKLNEIKNILKSTQNDVSEPVKSQKSEQTKA